MVGEGGGGIAAAVAGFGRCCGRLRRLRLTLPQSTSGPADQSRWCRCTSGRVWVETMSAYRQQHPHGKGRRRERAVFLELSPDVLDLRFLMTYHRIATLYEFDSPRRLRRCLGGVSRNHPSWLLL